MINQYRKEIEEIDLQIQALLKLRLDVVKKVGSYKKEHNLPVLDSKREKDLFLKIENLYGNDEYKNYYIQLMETIFTISKELQKWKNMD